MIVTQVVHKQTNVDLPQSVKVREAYMRGTRCVYNVKGNHATIELPHSVKVCEGYAKSNAKQKRIMIYRSP